MTSGNNPHDPDPMPDLLNSNQMCCPLLSNCFTLLPSFCLGARGREGVCRTTRISSVPGGTQADRCEWQET